MGPKPKPGGAPVVKDILTDPNFMTQIQEALAHTQLIREHLKVVRQNVLNFESMHGNLDMQGGINLLSHRVQNDLKETLKDLEETTKSVRTTFGILDPEEVYNNVELDKLDEEMCSTRPVI